MTLFESLEADQRIKVDLHNYCNIAFYDPWLKAQGYRQETLLKDIVDSCIEAGIGLTAVTSCQHEIPRGSVHDRLGVLESQLDSLPRGYSPFKLSENVLYVGKGDNGVYLINGQSVIVNQNGQRIHHIAVGSNQVPNGRDLNDTFKFCTDNNLLSIAVNPLCLAKHGMGLELFKENFLDYDAVLGHTGEICVPNLLAQIPVLGNKVAPLRKSINDEATELVENIRSTLSIKYLPGPSIISASSARWHNDFGKGYIEFDRNALDFSSEEKLISSLRENIQDKKYTMNKLHSSFWNLVKTDAISRTGKKHGWA